MPCEEGSELVVVGLGTEERGGTTIIELLEGVVDEEEILREEDEDKVEVGNDLELTVEVGTLEVDVGDADVDVVEEPLVEDAILLATVTCGIAVGANDRGIVA